MAIYTLKELIDWTRNVHGQMARCLSEAAQRHDNEMTRELLKYLASHELELEREVGEFEHQASDQELETREYDYLSWQTKKTFVPCDDRYANLDHSLISQEVFDFHNEIIGLYQALARRVVVPEMRQLLEQLLDMEEAQTRQLASQVGRMAEL
ncbi:MAG: ATPase [Halomonadaceae bacterium]|nr:MAG: ATPase [Halomonadaceae bacterium]